VHRSGRDGLVDERNASMPSAHVRRISAFFGRTSVRFLFFPSTNWLYKQARFFWMGKMERRTASKMHFFICMKFWFEPTLTQDRINSPSPLAILQLSHLSSAMPQDRFRSPLETADFWSDSTCWATIHSVRKRAKDAPKRTML
jgi:hypothetical protein